MKHQKPSTMVLCCYVEGSPIPIERRRGQCSCVDARDCDALAYEPIRDSLVQLVGPAGQQRPHIRCKECKAMRGPDTIRGRM
jgi:hypothetical protein